jgi:hypothetical protein
MIGVEVGQHHNRHSDDLQLIQAAPNQGRGSDSFLASGMNPVLGGIPLLTDRLAG